MTPENKALVKKINDAIAMFKAAAESVESALNGIVDDLSADVSDEEMTSVSRPEASPKPAPKTTKKPQTPDITEDDVRKVLGDKSRAGFTAEVKALITKYGVDKVSQLDPAQYAAVIHEAEGIK